MRYFICDRSTGNVILKNETILLISEFKALLDKERNKTKKDPKGEAATLAQKEFTYMFLCYDWESPYFKFTEYERMEAALQDSGLTEENLKDPLLIKACEKYNKLQNSTLEMRLLKACMDSVEKVITYLETVDPTERDDKGKPIFKTKTIIDEIKGAKDIITSLKELEDKVKEGLLDEGTLRGNIELGYYD